MLSVGLLSVLALVELKKLCFSNVRMSIESCVGLQKVVWEIT